MSEHISIETSDLAYSLDNVTERVAETTAAVHDMERSVCEAERQAAENVCTSVNRGFFTLIRSQLLQKKVQVQAVAEAQLFTLRHFAQSLRRIKYQMGVDFERITQRYTKLFVTLGDSLRSRVYALDRPVAEIADVDYCALDRRVLTTGAPAAVVQQDSVSVVSELAAVRCKKDCQKVLEGVKTLIDHGAKLNKTMESIVRDVHQDVQRSVYVPVIVAENTDLYIEGSTQLNVHIPVMSQNSAGMSKMKEAFYASMRKMAWGTSVSEHKADVDRRVRELAQGPGLDERTRKYILQMLDNSDWNKLEAIG